MTGEGQAHGGGVDVDHPALGVVDEHGLAEAELLREQLPLAPLGHEGTLTDDAEFVAVPAPGAAEDAHHVVVSHGGIQAAHTPLRAEEVTP